jgi:CubicO group peptidase (beta-lactamase class C family)
MRRATLLCRLTAAISGVVATASAQAPGGGDLERRLDSLTGAYHELGQFDGAVLVAREGRVLFARAYGEANREWTVPNTVDTRFRIGSMTKAVTAVLVLQLVDNGRIGLDSTISRYVADSVFPRRLGDRITVRQLLTHTSGLPDFNDVPDFYSQMNAGLMSDGAILRRIGEYELRFEPGGSFGYSNDGYVLLGEILEGVTGVSYESLVAERVFRPAGMTESGYHNATRLVPRRASGYRWSGNGVTAAAPYLATPAAGLYSTVRDLARYDEALYGDALLSPAGKTIAWQRPSGNAYGWHVSRERWGSADSILIVRSDGAVPGFFARSIRIPSAHLYVVALTNVRGPRNRLPVMVDALARAALALPYDMPKASLGMEIARASTARRLNEWLRTRVPVPELGAVQSAFDVDELEINLAGYAPLRVNIADALTIFGLNARLFPASANVHDSLGEALLVAGDTVRAIASYERALERAPGNQGLRRFIAVLKAR